MFGKPVICSNVGAMAERVANEVDGLHFEMGDPASLARAMKRAATEEGLWSSLFEIAVPAASVDDGGRVSRSLQCEARHIVGFA